MLETEIKNIMRRHNLTYRTYMAQVHDLNGKKGTSLRSQRFRILLIILENLV